MSGRVRPIEKFAEAVGKCSVEVRSRMSTLYRWTSTDFALRLQHTANVSLQTISQFIKTCVRKNLCASKIVIWYVFHCASMVLLTLEQKAAKKP
jgi:hypothetical protein